MKRERILMSIILAVSLALPVVSYYSFKTGYLTAKEIWTAAKAIKASI